MEDCQLANPYETQAEEVHVRQMTGPGRHKAETPLRYSCWSNGEPSGTVPEEHAQLGA